MESSLVLVSNLQLLDNVLPIIRESKMRTPNHRFILVFTAEHTIVTAGPSHPLLELSQDFADEIWFPVGASWSVVRKQDGVNTFGDIAGKSSRASRFTFAYRYGRLFSNASFFSERFANLFIDIRAVSQKIYLDAINRVRAHKVICLSHGEPVAYLRDFEASSLEMRDKASRSLSILEQMPGRESIKVFVMETEGLTGPKPEEISVHKLSHPPRLDDGWLDHLKHHYIFGKNPNPFEEMGQFGVFFSIAHLRKKSQEHSIVPDLWTKQVAIDEVKALFLENHLTPVYVKHPHEHTKDLDLDGWVTGANIHNSVLMLFARVSISMGTSINFDTYVLGLPNFEYRPDVSYEEAIAISKRQKFSQLAVDGYELRNLYHKTNSSQVGRRSGIKGLASEIVTSMTS